MNNIYDILQGDCFDIVQRMQSNSVNLIYLDPPFFTQKQQSLKTRDRQLEFSYNDLWESEQDYAKFIHDRLAVLYHILREDGSIFVHCDTHANYMIRVILNHIFGHDNFRSEIIWSYKRWSNSKKGLLPAHQTIFFYSKTNQFTFNPIYCHYSESTNVDQILQKRTRDEYGKAVYARDDEGEIIAADPKKGVPLSDVWEIPYLNPKAKERVGYPSQKPILLLEQIIELASNPGDIVLDPFCGSGTTIIAAKLLNRSGIGIDISPDAVQLSKDRLKTPMKSESVLLQKGRKAYLNVDEEALNIISSLDIIPVQRNQGIDAILKQNYGGKPVPIRVQRQGESLHKALSLLHKASQVKGALKSILVKTSDDLFDLEVTDIPPHVMIIESPAYTVHKVLS
ncbi:putative Site-specific DNA-methyltransferase (adenine-specific) [Planktothrix serta PCC 8927]|uniref:Methyltransferase n=1 Tax=Planktothrix serta PCC 8927 TaxID=671068 RepID=A0A7Z9DZM3_9CYAN|nr:site-specific DNA-methyltransferase [Planktothrix serta]VXD15231.1 putative Site-specific DNA-methyltransferase (adenine-specific) [Planktothrix serta PCC 8927]